MHYLSSQGVEHVINLRSDKEMETFTKDNYAEDSLCQALGMTYFRVPIAGKEDYSPETLEEFTKVLEENSEKVFIHCYSGYRLTYLMMAWLIEAKLYFFVHTDSYQ